MHCTPVAWHAIVMFPTPDEPQKWLPHLSLFSKSEEHITQEQSRTGRPLPYPTDSSVPHFSRSLREVGLFLIFIRHRGGLAVIFQHVVPEK